jgi:hypothetical protein
MTPVLSFAGSYMRFTALCAIMHLVEILYHPYFAAWFDNLVDVNIEVAGEMQALISELEEHGHNLGWPESVRLVTSTFGLRELRRTPATNVTPYAVGPPVLRVIYGFVRTDSGELAAAILLGGDKTELGNAWYPRNIGEAESRLIKWAAREGWTVYY